MHCWFDRLSRRANSDFRQLKPEDFVAGNVTRDPSGSELPNPERRVRRSLLKVERLVSAEREQISFVREACPPGIHHDPRPPISPGPDD